MHYFSIFRAPLWGPGFFYLENHGIHSSVFENAIDQMNGFFTKCSYEDKLEILNHGYAGAPQGKSSKGYVPPGMEGNYQKGCLPIWIIIIKIVIIISIIKWNCNQNPYLLRLK